MKFIIKTLCFKGIFLFIVFLSPFQNLISQDIYVNSNSAPYNYGGECENGQKILLKGDWNKIENGKKIKIKIPGAVTKEEKVVLEKTFFVSNDLYNLKSFRLVSLGINHYAEIFINNIFIGKHEGGYLPFTILIKENVLQYGGENVIKIVADNRLDAYKTIPLRQQIGGWKNFGGIVRDIYIEVLPKIFIEKIKTTKIEITKQNATVYFSANIFGNELQNEDTTINVNFEIFDVLNSNSIGKSEINNISIKENRDNQINSKINITNPVLWSIENPNRYLAKVKIRNLKNELIDQRNIYFGIKEISIDKNNLKLNYQNIFINGLNWIEEYKIEDPILSLQQMEADIVSIKSLGANAIKFSFHPPHPFMLELCDKFGILAFIEMPFYEFPKNQLQNDFIKIKINQYFNETIALANNFTSASFISSGESFDLNNESIDLINEMNSNLKKEFQIFSFYTFKSLNNNLSKIKSDIIFADPNLVEKEKYFDVLQNLKNNFNNKPLFISRIGFEAEPFNRSGFSNPISLEAQAKYFYNYYPQIEKNKFNGAFVWSYNDFSSERPSIVTPSENYFIRTFGIVEMWRDKKPAFDAIKTIFQKEKPIAVEVGNYSIQTPITFVVLGLILLISLTWYFNSSNRFRENFVRALFRPFNFFVDVRDHKSLPFFQTTFMALVISFTIGIIVSTILLKLKTSFMIDYLFSSLIPSDDFKIFVISIIRNSWSGVFFISILILLMFIFWTIIIQVLAFISRKKIYFFHSYSLVVWSTLPITLFIPVGMILYRIIETDFYLNLVIILFIISIIWNYLRSVQGFSIVYDLPYLKVFSISMIAIILIFISTAIYLDQKFAIISYSDFYFSTIKPNF